LRRALTTCITKILNLQPSTCKPSTCKPSTFNLQTFNLQTFNLQPANLQPSTFNLQPSTFNLQTFNLQPSTINLQPSTHFQGRVVGYGTLQPQCTSIDLLYIQMEVSTVLSSRTWLTLLRKDRIIGRDCIGCDRARF
jgi:hypothetical protein